MGFRSPILADNLNYVLAGHARLEAAKQLGLKAVPVIRFSDMSEVQKRAYMLADNRLPMGAGWDLEILALELGELSDLLPTEGVEVSDTGFEVAEVDTYLAAAADPASEPADELPPLPERATTRRGDMWLVGKHRILCGDSRDRHVIEFLMEDARAAAVFCDPPYNVQVKGIVGRGRVKHPEFAFASGEMRGEEFPNFLRVTLLNSVQFSKPGAVHYVCMDWRHVADLLQVGREIYGATLNLISWVKSNAGQGSFYRSQHELIAVFRVGDESHRNNVELGRYGRNRSNVWTYAGVNSFSKGRMEALKSHPTVKPVALVADALLDCTKRGDAVLDHFLGSGTTILAAEKTGRIGYGVEYEPKYVDVAIKRWQDLTKRDAILAGDGRTFGEIAAARAETDGRDG